MFVFKNIGENILGVIFFKRVDLLFLKEPLNWINIKFPEKIASMASKPINILEPVVKIMYRIVYHNIDNLKMYNYKIKTSFICPCLRRLGANKTGFNLNNCTFLYPGKAVYNTIR